jgi:hypothetical protein
MDDEKAKAPAGKIFRKIFHHPNFNAVAGIVTIISAILAIYFYEKSIQKPDLTYYISPARTPIVQKGNLNNFSVTFQGVPIKGDLSTAEIQIWNQGNAPILSNDILLPVSIRLANGEAIYQTTISTTRDVIGVQISPCQEGGAFSFDWKILEQNDGIKLQMIYGGSVNSAIIVDGTIIHQKHMRREQFALDSLTIGPLVVWTVSLLTTAVFCVLIWVKNNPIKKFNIWDYLYLWAMFLLVGGWAGYQICEGLHARLSKPPFGF